MRVKVSRSVDLEEIPKNIADFLEESRQILLRVTSDMEDSYAALTSKDKHTLPVAVQKLDGVRTKLGRVDSDLKDYMDHLVAYVNISKQLEEATVSAASTQPQEAGGQGEN